MSIEQRIEEATYWAHREAESLRTRLSHFNNDAQLPIRKCLLECKACHYLRGARIAMQAFTERGCESCMTTIEWHNSNVPRICETCALAHDACRHCMAALEFPEEISSAMYRGRHVQVCEFLGRGLLGVPLYWVVDVEDGMAGPAYAAELTDRSGTAIEIMDATL